MNKLQSTLIALCLCSCAPPPCEALPHQFEQTSYEVNSASYTDSGIGLDGPLDPAEVDRIADWVDECLSGLGSVTREAQCTQSRPWEIDRTCTTVKAVPGVESCTMPGVWLLPDDAGDSCDKWNKPTSAPDGTDCSTVSCKWAVATQNGGRTIVVPQEDPTTRLAEGLVRVATSCWLPWSDPGLARCSHGPRTL